MYSFKRFNTLSEVQQIEQLSAHGVLLDLACEVKNTEVVLFAYHNFYVELTVIRYTDEILSIKSFQGMKKLEPYLPQVDISEITALLACG